MKKKKVVKAQLLLIILFYIVLPDLTMNPSFDSDMSVILSVDPPTLDPDTELINLPDASHNPN